jgi:hypothetical protein
LERSTRFGRFLLKCVEVPTQSIGVAEVEALNLKTVSVELRPLADTRRRRRLSRKACPKRVKMQFIAFAGVDDAELSAADG